MQPTEDRGAELEATWRREIPLAAAMQLSVARCSAEELVVRAPLAPSRNLHGTAFAGALFSVCVLTGWGATWLALRERSLEGSIVVADARIRYRRAIAGEIVCRCCPGPNVVAESLAALPATGRARLTLDCAVLADDKPVVTFEGDYVVHARPD